MARRPSMSGRKPSEPGALPERTGADTGSIVPESPDPGKSREIRDRRRPDWTGCLTRLWRWPGAPTGLTGLGVFRADAVLLVANDRRAGRPCLVDFSFAGQGSSEHEV